MKFSMVIPVYNESKCIAKVVLEVLMAFERLKVQPAEVIVVDDGSTDDTLDILMKLAEKDNRIRIITHSTNRGIGIANRTGFTAARGEWIGWVPGDGQFNPNEVLDLYLQNQYVDMVVTSVSLNDRLRMDNFFRIFISKGLRFLIRLFTRWDGRMTGIFLFKKAIYQDDLPRMTTGLFNILFPIVVQKKGYRITYSGISLRPRMGGYSKVANATTILKTFYELMKFRFANHNA